MKNTKTKKKVISILFAILTLFLISLFATLILYLFDIIYYDDGFVLNREIFEHYKSSWYGPFIIIFIQVSISIFVSFVPGTTAAFIILWQALYENPFVALLYAFTGVILSSIAMYFIGKYGGYNICKKLLGEEDCEKAASLLDHKGKVFFPLMMLFPIFPDDALVMIAGTLKMDLKWFLPSIFIGRGIGIATIIFGLAIVPFEKFTSIWHWIVFVIICAVLIIIVFMFANKLNKYLESRRVD